MHMTDALLSPGIGAGFWAASIGAIGYASRKIRHMMDEKLVPLMGVLGAFIFSVQMINFAIPGTGSSGHITGGVLLAVILGPHAALIVMSSVLTVQALFFADGGILGLGSNIWNLGVYTCYIAYPFVYRTIAGRDPSRRRIIAASIAAVVVGLQLGSLSVVMQTVLSGKSDLDALVFIKVMQPIHLAIGIIEGIITAGTLNYIIKLTPALLRKDSKGSEGHKEWITAIVALITVFLIAGVISWYASEKPDGLEYSLDLAGRTVAEEIRSDIQDTLALRLQNATTVYPDYGEGSRIGTTASGVLGAGIVLLAVIGVGLGTRTLNAKVRRKAR